MAHASAGTAEGTTEGQGSRTETGFGQPAEGLLRQIIEKRGAADRGARCTLRAGTCDWCETRWSTGLTKRPSMMTERFALAGSHRAPVSAAHVVGLPNPSDLVDVTLVLRRRSALHPRAAAAPMDRLAFAIAHGADRDDVRKVEQFAARFNPLLVGSASGFLDAQSRSPARSARSPKRSALRSSCTNPSRASIGGALANCSCRPTFSTLLLACSGSTTARRQGRDSSGSRTIAP